MKTIKQLDENCRYWFTRELLWADEFYSDDYKLLRMPLDRKHQDNGLVYYGVRDTIWYATGLLMRQQEGDIARALAIIEKLMSYQFDEPEAVFHGTFYRYHGEPHPPENPTVWRDYDPNWREFIGTVFIILLKDFGELLSDELQDKMRHSIHLAAQGAFERKVAAEYTNISLMSAFLLDYAGEIFNNARWCEYSLSQAQLINNLFNRYKTFNEYNSPTYYGVDFYALALWRKYGSTATYRDLGAAMEAELWRDTVQFYHAGMQNVCGPYDRSYGMDMTEYLALVGLWIAAAVPSGYAPLPDIDQHFEHAADFFFMPLVALVETKPPKDVLPYLAQFQEERTLKRTIEPNRELSAWLSDTLMLGAEADNLNETRTNQFHPATAHWKLRDNSIGWIKIRSESMIQALAKPYELQLSSKENANYIFEIHAHGIQSSMIQPNQWNLPNLIVQLEGENTAFEVKQEGDTLIVQFESGEAIKLHFST